MVRYGIMQGRLTASNGRGIQFFPFENWEKEFDIGAQIGIDEIEWIFDFASYEENPLWNEDGCNTINNIMNETGVRVYSVCFDYFMRRPFFKQEDYKILEENEIVAKRIIRNMSLIGANLIEIPLVDDSSMKSYSEEKAVIEFAREIANYAAQYDILVGFETDLAPGFFRRFLDRIGGKNIRANYDSGNSSGIGYDHKEEILSLGNYVANVHIKDRIIHGGTVKLGTGNADFKKVFSSLQAIGYRGAFILQAARGMDGEEKDNIMNQLEFVRKYTNKYIIEA